MIKEHIYNLTVEWTGNRGDGTIDFRSYGREHKIWADDKVEIEATSDPAFRGDKTKYNPEEFLVASLSSCHMLWFLHLCADNGVVVVDYIDKPVGIMLETEDGGGRFQEVRLVPTITVTDISMADKIDELHKRANGLCFIANSVNFPVYHQSKVLY